LDAASGADLWSLEVPDGYGAARSAIAEGVIVITAHAPREADVRPPIVYGIDPQDGKALWDTELTAGTDLQPTVPPTANGVAVVATTLSHPGSASGNLVHGLDLASGEVLWTVDLGGEQSFQYWYPNFIIAGIALLAGPDGTTAVGVNDGRVIWHNQGVRPLVLSPSGALYGIFSDLIVEIDPLTGDQRGFADMASPVRPWALATKSLLVLGDLTRLFVYEATAGTLILDWVPPSNITDVPAIADGFLSIPTGNRAVHHMPLP
jgi:outer membrane protein assembly factor BamB